MSRITVNLGKAEDHLLITDPLKAQFAASVIE